MCVCFNSCAQFIDNVYVLLVDLLKRYRENQADVTLSDHAKGECDFISFPRSVSYSTLPTTVSRTEVHPTVQEGQKWMQDLYM